MEIFKSNLNEYALILNSSGTGWGSGMLFKNTAGIDYGIYSGSDGKWHFANNNQSTDNMVIDNNGYVGLGTSSPGAKLHLHNELFGTGRIRLSTGAANAETYELGQGIMNISNGGFSIRDMTNNVDRMVIQYGSGNVGIGTEQPTCKLSVAGDIILSDSYSRTLSFGNIAMLHSSFESYGSLTFRLHNGNGFSNVMKISGNGEYNLDVSGKIRANEIVVNTEGADFVFKPEYKLADLEEIENYIVENKHLPGIPSAKSMQEDGMNMSEMQTTLLQKIEEITLYLIELKKENTELRNELQQLKSRNKTQSE